MNNITSGRAIDRHENLILEVLDCIERHDLTLSAASYHVAEGWTTKSDPITADRLAHLVCAWCAVAGIDPPR